MVNKGWFGEDVIKEEKSRMEMLEKAAWVIQRYADKNPHFLDELMQMERAHE